MTIMIITEEKKRFTTRGRFKKMMRLYILICTGKPVEHAPLNKIFKVPNFPHQDLTPRSWYHDTLREKKIRRKSKQYIGSRRVRQRWRAERRQIYRWSMIKGGSCCCRFCWRPMILLQGRCTNVKTVKFQAMRVSKQLERTWFRSRWSPGPWRQRRSGGRSGSWASRWQASWLIRCRWPAGPCREFGRRYSG